MKSPAGVASPLFSTNKWVAAPPQRPLCVILRVFHVSVCVVCSGAVLGTGEPAARGAIFVGGRHRRGVRHEQLKKKKSPAPRSGFL